jgi:zinc protease
VVKEEYRMRIENAPYGKIFTHVLDLVLTNAHPYGRLPIGSIPDLDSARLEDVRAFHDEYYKPDNATLVLVGDFKTDEAVAKIRRYFGAIPASKDRKFARRPVRESGSRRKSAAPTTTSWRRCPRSAGVRRARRHRRRRAGLRRDRADPVRRAELRLYRSLVRDKQLAVGAQGSALSLQLGGIFYFFGVGAAGKDPGAIEAALAEQVELLRTTPVSDAELAKAKNQVLTAQVFGTLSTEQKANALGLADLVHGTPEEANRAFDKIRRVTADGRPRVAQKVLRARTAQRVRRCCPKRCARRARRRRPRPRRRPDHPGGPVRTRRFRTLTSCCSRLPAAGPRRRAVRRWGREAGGEEAPAPPRQPRKRAPRGGRRGARSRRRRSRPRARCSSRRSSSGPCPTASGSSCWRTNGSPALWMRLAVPAGSIRDPRTRSGLAEMTAGLLDKGTATRTESQIADTIDGLGARLSADANPDHIIVSASGLSAHTDTLFDLLADVALRPTFPAPELDRLRTRTLSAIQSTWRRRRHWPTPPSRAVSTAPPRTATTPPARRKRWGDHAGGPRGLPQDVFAPNQATLFLVGDISAARPSRRPRRRSVVGTPGRARAARAQRGRASLPAGRPHHDRGPAGRGADRDPHRHANPRVRFPPPDRRLRHRRRSGTGPVRRAPDAGDPGQARPELRRGQFLPAQRVRRPVRDRDVDQERVHRRGGAARAGRGAEADDGGGRAPAELQDRKNFLLGSFAVSVATPDGILLRLVPRRAVRRRPRRPGPLHRAGAGGDPGAGPAARSDLRLNDAAEIVLVGDANADRPQVEPLGHRAR